MMPFYIVWANLNQVLCYLQPKALYQRHTGTVIALGKCRIYLQFRFQAEKDPSHHRVILNHFYFYDMKKASCARVQKSDPGREQRRRPLRLDLNNPDPRRMSLLCMLKGGMLNKCVSKDYLAVAGLWNGSPMDSSTLHKNHVGHREEAPNRTMLVLFLSQEQWETRTETTVYLVNSIIP